MTLDGQLAMPRSSSKRDSSWFTSQDSRRRVHFLRHSNDALLTGIGTVLADDPLLTDRSGSPRRRPLLRVVLDSELRLPLNTRIVKSSDRDVLVCTTARLDSRKALRLQASGVELVRLPDRGGKVDLKSVLVELGRREILSVLLEAGPGINTSALAAGIVDKFWLFYAPKFAGRSTVPFAKGPQTLPPLRNLRLRESGSDIFIEGYLRDPYA
jgi:diaminohydroxyphosphoribosylaminopyrimidine deaminase/5-amino-6-(5-phosphoribosylamino)uracil reductase